MHELRAPREGVPTSHAPCHPLHSLSSQKVFMTSWLCSAVWCPYGAQLPGVCGKNCSLPHSSALQYGAHPRLPLPRYLLQHPPALPLLYCAIGSSLSLFTAPPSVPSRPPPLFPHATPPRVSVATATRCLAAQICNPQTIPSLPPLPSPLHSSPGICCNNRSHPPCSTLQSGTRPHQVTGRCPGSTSHAQVRTTAISN